LDQAVTKIAKSNGVSDSSSIQRLILETKKWMIDYPSNSTTTTTTSTTTDDEKKKKKRRMRNGREKRVNTVATTSSDELQSLAKQIELFRDGLDKIAKQVNKLLIEKIENKIVQINQDIKGKNDINRRGGRRKIPIDEESGSSSSSIVSDKYDEENSDDSFEKEWQTSSSTNIDKEEEEEEEEEEEKIEEKIDESTVTPTTTLAVKSEDKDEECQLKQLKQLEKENKQEETREIVTENFTEENASDKEEKFITKEKFDILAPTSSSPPPPPPLLLSPQVVDKSSDSSKIEAWKSKIMQDMKIVESKMKFDKLIREQQRLKQGGKRKLVRLDKKTSSTLSTSSKRKKRSDESTAKKDWIGYTGQFLRYDKRKVHARNTCAGCSVASKSCEPTVIDFVPTMQNIKLACKFCFNVTF
jgi:hypothetical protein